MSMSMEGRTRLMPWTRLYSIAYRLMARHLAKMTRDDLRSLMRACDEPTETNCDWRTYRVARLLQPEIIAELHHRQRFRPAPTPEQTQENEQ